MPQTHDYETRSVLAKDLDSSCVIVGESGGLCAVYEVDPSNLMMGCLAVETEFGFLYLFEDESVDVLTDEGGE